MAKKKKVIRKTSSAVSFEQALDELTSIVSRLEDGDLSLDASLKDYEKGIVYLRQCHRLLADAERKIQLLKDVDADGNPIEEPFEDDAASSLEAKAQARSRRRSVRKSPSSQPDTTDSDLFS